MQTIGQLPLFPFTVIRRVEKVFFSVHATAVIIIEQVKHSREAEAASTFAFPLPDH